LFASQTSAIFVPRLVLARGPIAGMSFTYRHGPILPLRKLEL
jgi:hypothetical protein